MMIPAIVSLFFWLFPASAAPIVQTEPAYEPDPTQRGTFSLVWGCISTLGLCIWTAMHPNVVPMRRKFPPVYYKATLMVGAIIFPEIMMCMAIAQWRLARKVHKAWQEAWKGEVDGVNNGKEWLGMAGAYFVVMGGYIVQPTPASNQGDNNAPENQPLLKHPKASSRPQKQEGELVTTITAQGFMALLKNNFKNDIRSGQLQQAQFDHFIIEDKGKSSTVAKTIVTLQVLWMIVQIGGRVREGLPVTLLEASVAVQIPYSIISFFFWWNKPLDVGEPIAITVDINSLRPLDHNQTQTPPEPHSPRALFITENISHDSFLHMVFRAAYDVVYYFDQRLEFFSAITAIINGGLHATMWNAYFPTPIERLLWRTACIGMGLCPVIYYFLVRGQGFERRLQQATFGIRNVSGVLKQQIAIIKFVWDFCKEFVGGEKRKCHSVCGRIAHVILLGLVVDAYVMCILYLTVESFVSLRKLPVGSYTLVEWSSIIPHF
ncbi:uncharacterized protein BO80DRAFT_423057 [Aspergillus ibericus CBS 121593]|uniref:Wax synthase domain-containing protein n=1 Tax=Aspergillus ibericus CBS 121593 TaxID=1448316 RepID=A0A395H6R2_9EURO|nr:hypothetical protein BO80DRAFT_423057 [Aspergillus ibericus CBS 121593]RAL03621.1 hypothetical protein BO80DRAFT_423057 [Aspergillus ibericus CBS 121593]